MADESIPEDVRDFIIRHIDSVALLEALLLLRNDPAQDWNAQTMAKRLYVGERDVADILARLCESRRARQVGDSYRYDGGTEVTRAIVDRLAEVYAKQLIPVTSLIHAK